MVPLPPLDVMTGMFVASASLTRACSASDRDTPPPAYIRGMLAWAMRRETSRSCSGLGTMREIGAGFRSSTSSRSTPASGGISRSTGRGRPVRICLNTSVTASGTSRGLSTSRRYLVTGRTTSGWSRISCTAPRSLPMRSRGIWPAITSTAEERAYAVASPAAAL